MLAEKLTPAAHAGEDQASAAVSALILAAKTLAYDHLQKQRDDIRACDSAQHHQSVRALFAAIDRADATGLSDACATAAVASRVPQRDPRVPDMFETGGAA
jgi:hypothetical protein